MQVEIWSDVVCPWCAVGKARFEQALAEFEHADEVEVTWRSFELDTRRAATTDIDYVTMLSAKYGTGRDEAQQMIDRMVEAGAAEGIDFRFDIARPGNTFDAHRVLHLARREGLGHEVKARFLAGYHSEGAAIADHEVLVRLAVDAGLDEPAVRAVLAGDAFAEAVRAEEQEAVDLGVRGVPFFVLDRRYGVSGAQPVPALLQALEQAYADTADTLVHHDDAHDHAADEACVDGVCAV